MIYQRRMAKIGIFNTLITAIIMVIIKPIVKGEAFSVMLYIRHSILIFQSVGMPDVRFILFIKESLMQQGPSLSFEKIKKLFCKFQIIESV